MEKIIIEILEFDGTESPLHDNEKFYDVSMLTYKDDVLVQDDFIKTYKTKKGAMNCAKSYIIADKITFNKGVL